MKQTKYQYEVYVERKLMKEIKGFGFYVWRSADSRSPVDIYVCHFLEGEMWVFRVKRVNKIKDVYNSDNTEKLWVKKEIEKFQKAQIPNWWKKILAVYVNEKKDFDMFMI